LQVMSYDAMRLSVYAALLLSMAEVILVGLFVHAIAVCEE